MFKFNLNITLSNVKLSNSELNNLKSGIKNYTKVTLNLSSVVIIADSNDEAYFLLKLLLTIHKFQGFVRLLQIVHQLYKIFKNSDV